MKNSVCVHISFTHLPPAIRNVGGSVVFAIGLKLLVPTPGKHGSMAVKDFIG